MHANYNSCHLTQPWSLLPHTLRETHPLRRATHLWSQSEKGNTLAWQDPRERGGGKGLGLKPPQETIFLRPTLLYSKDDLDINQMRDIATHSFSGSLGNNFDKTRPYKDTHWKTCAYIHIRMYCLCWQVNIHSLHSKYDYREVGAIMCNHNGTEANKKVWKDKQRRQKNHEALRLHPVTSRTSS